MDKQQIDILNTQFDPRFLEDHVGRSILSDPKVAIMELIANAWDAYATEVFIKWPDKEDLFFSIEDNGSGMTEHEFSARWMTMSYNRKKVQGEVAEIPNHLGGASSVKPRMVFGQNGKGRHAGFYFNQEEFFVETKKEGKLVTFKVFRPPTGERPLACKKEKELEVGSIESGTKIFATVSDLQKMKADEIRSEIGMRFLSDPDFNVFVNGEKVNFEDIPKENVDVFELDITPDSKITIIKIITKKVDKTTRQHGIAWHVNNRLVGDADWKNLGDKNFIDGRKASAKRYCFIVQADCLHPHVLTDWSGFKAGNSFVDDCFRNVNQKIKEVILEDSKEERKQAFECIKSQNQAHIKKMRLSDIEIWETFIKKIQEECPNIQGKDIENIAAILAALESSRTKYALLDKLVKCSANDIDAINEVLETWGIEAAKLVLDELEDRLRVIDELSKKMLDDSTDELHELQPIFERGLWIFGPEFESVFFTSNKTMATVIKKLLKREDISGSANRPDFVITQDGSLGFYGCPEYDFDSGAETGIAKLIIVELKKPSISLGREEKNQCWKYVCELDNKGLLLPHTKVSCYLLGKTIDKNEKLETKERDGTVRILPMTYDTVLSRAKSRTHMLYEKIQSAPFLKKEDVETYISSRNGNMPLQQDVFD